MGRGLSPLQNWMLRKALENRQRENRDATSNGADLYYNEVKAGFFHLMFKTVPNPEYNVLRNVHDGHRFDDSEPGYAAASASISRSTRRLRDRGLVVWILGYSHWSGISLTEAGIGYVLADIRNDITDRGGPIRVTSLATLPKT